MALKVKGQGENRKTVIRGTKKNCLIVCVGDSTTDTALSYANVSLKYFAQAAAPINATVVNRAHAGQGIPYLSSVLASEVLALNPDIITISMLLNDLGVGAAANMTDYITTCLAHTNPNGKKPLIIGMTDNPTGSSQNATRPLAAQDATANDFMNIYNGFTEAAGVYAANTYAAFMAFGRDSPTFISLMHPDDIHPSSPLGHDLYMKTLNPQLAKAVWKFYNY